MPLLLQFLHWTVRGGPSGIEALISSEAWVEAHRGDREDFTDEFIVQAETQALAVCLVVLLAKGVEVIV
jgi:uncharacterized ion transporter superfamily protein YfcC